MKDKKAVILYILLTLIIWQLGVSISKILGNSFHFGDLISIVPVINNGAAFGLFYNNSYVLGALGVFVILALFLYVYKKLTRYHKTKILLSSILTAGILGNTVERFMNGYVNDFIKINLFNFPVFNIFDILITGSVFLYIIYCVKKELLKRVKH